MSASYQLAEPEEPTSVEATAVPWVCSLRRSRQVSIDGLQEAEQ